MTQLITQSGKPISQVVEEARKFCEMNNAPKTMKLINELYSETVYFHKTTEEIIAETKGMSDDETQKFCDSKKVVDFDVYNKTLQNKLNKNREVGYTVQGEKRLPEYVIEELGEVLTN